MSADEGGSILLKEYPHVHMKHEHEHEQGAILRPELHECGRWVLAVVNSSTDGGKTGQVRYGM